HYVRKFMDSREAKGVQESAGFGQGFVVFGGTNRVSDDASTGVEVSRAIFANGGANGDAELAFAVEAEIAEGAGVRAAGDRFEFVDDFHCAEFGRAGNASAREAGRKRREMRDAGTQ